MKQSLKWLAVGVATVGMSVFSGCTNGTGNKVEEGTVSGSGNKTEHPSKPAAPQDKPKDHPAH